MKHRKIDRLVYLFSKLPGLGSRTAKRIVLYLVKHRERLMAPIGEALIDASSAIQECTICNNLDEGDTCCICADQKRDSKIICVVESVIDLWALENANFYRGTYHVLGGTLSSNNRNSIEELNIEKLIERAKNGVVQEVIIATNATIDGQTTAFFITEKLKNLPLKITRFANGIPIGGELDYLDEVTITTAFNSRQNF